MPWRHQVPAYSPVSTAALLDGVRAAVGGPAHAEPAEARVVALLAERYSPKAVLLTDSGTTALTVALIGALLDRPGCVVALPAFSCYDVATAADGAGVPVLLYDTDPHTLAPDLESVREVLRRGAAAVVVVHLYGCPVDLTEINRLAAEASAIVIEDAAQGAGATVGGRPAGALGSLAVLSFGRGKGLTGGSGGALLAHDATGARMLQRVQRLLDDPAPGWSDLIALGAQMVLGRASVYAVPAALPFLRLGQTVYREPRPLRRPSAASCSVVAATWPLSEREVDARRRHAERFLLELRWQRELAAIRPPAHTRPGYLRLPVLASGAARRAADQPAARRLGIMPGYPKALSDLDGFGARRLNLDSDFPGARLLAARLCTLPTHGRLGPGDCARLEQWIRKVGGR